MSGARRVSCPITFRRTPLRCNSAISRGDNGATAPLDPGLPRKGASNFPMKNRRASDRGCPVHPRHDGAPTASAPSMAGDARQAARPRPATVAVHDDRNVSRQRRGTAAVSPDRSSDLQDLSVFLRERLVDAPDVVVRSGVGPPAASLRCWSCEISASFSRRLSTSIPSRTHVSDRNPGLLGIPCRHARQLPPPLSLRSGSGRGSPGLPSAD